MGRIIKVDIDDLFEILGTLEDGGYSIPTIVFDIIDELNDYGCDLDVFDPWIEEKDVDQKNFTFIRDPFKGEKKYDAIIAAVGHKAFAELSRSDYENISTQEPVLIDIKGIVEDPTWRL